MDGHGGFAKDMASANYLYMQGEKLSSHEKQAEEYVSTFREFVQTNIPSTNRDKTGLNF